MKHNETVVKHLESIANRGNVNTVNPNTLLRKLGPDFIDYGEFRNGLTALHHKLKRGGNEVNRKLILDLVQLVRLTKMLPGFNEVEINSFIRKHEDQNAENTFPWLVDWFYMLYSNRAFR